jgi:hypothetical protein
MKKSGLPSGAVRNAMDRDNVKVPPGFLDNDDVESNAPMPVRKPAAPPVQAVKNFAHRVSNRMVGWSRPFSERYIFVIC